MTATDPTRARSTTTGAAGPRPPMTASLRLPRYPYLWVSGAL